MVTNIASTKYFGVDRFFFANTFRESLFVICF